RRQRSHERFRPLNPVAQLVVTLDACRGDQHPALHRLAGDVELPDVRLLQRLSTLVRAEPDDQRILPDAHKHVAAQQEAGAAEQPLRPDVLAPGQPLPDALGKSFAEGHWSLRGPLPSSRYSQYSQNPDAGCYSANSMDSASRLTIPRVRTWRQCWTRTIRRR